MEVSRRRGCVALERPGHGVGFRPHTCSCIVTNMNPAVRTSIEVCSDCGSELGIGILAAFAISKLPEDNRTCPECPRSRRHRLGHALVTSPVTQTPEPADLTPQPVRPGQLDLAL
jgi:hypothetical protein